MLFRLKQSISKFHVVALALLFAVTVAGCGGGGSSSTTGLDGDGMTTPMPGATDEEKITTAQTAAMNASDAAAAAVAAVMAMKDYDLASYTRAQVAAEMAMDAYMAAKAATTVDAAETAQAAAETARDDALKYAGMVTMAKMDADDAKMADDARKAANKVALSKKTAITAEDAGTTNRPFDSNDAYNTADGADNAATNYRMQIKHDGGAKVTITDGMLPAENDPMFEQAATFGNGQMIVRNIGTDRKIIVVHTDIEAPESLPFGSASGYTLNFDIDTKTTANDTYTLVPADDAADLGGSAIVPTNKGGSQTLSQFDDATITDNTKRPTYRGTLNGAAGTFRCYTDTCTIGKTDDTRGTLSITGSGVLRFTPDAGAKVSVPDSDYLYYGFWLDTKTKDGDVTEYEAVQTFAGSSLATSANLSAVTGTATYEGDAAGVYVHETNNDDGTLHTATSGRFTADVALKAYFDATTTRTTDTIEGTISNFDLEHGEANKWNVNVSAAGIDTDEGFTGNASGMTGDTGSLSGRFHGTGDAVDETVAPPVLVGEFNANFINGTAAGAFGTRKQP